MIRGIKSVYIARHFLCYLARLCCDIFWVHLNGEQMGWKEGVDREEVVK
jgi:hypothetical protein